MLRAHTWQAKRTNSADLTLLPLLQRCKRWPEPWSVSLLRTGSCHASI